jgi:Domain of unknown function (DUF4258)
MRLVFSAHAIKKMFERGIGVEEVRAALANAKVVASYPDDQPFPSELLLAYGSQPLHVVAAKTDTGETVVITVYRPDPALWNENFDKRLP